MTADIRPGQVWEFRFGPVRHRATVIHAHTDALARNDFVILHATRRSRIRARNLPARYRLVHDPEQQLRAAAGSGEGQ